MHNLKKQSRLEVKKYSFFEGTIAVWNKLYPDCVYANSDNMLNNRIDKYLVNAGYNYNKDVLQIE